MTGRVEKFRYLTHSSDTPTPDFGDAYKYQIPVKRIPKGTVLFTYYNDNESIPPGTLEDFKRHHLIAAYYARTGRFQSIKFDNDTGNFKICFSRHQKPLFFYSFPGLGKGVVGREYTTIVPVVVQKDINVAHLRSGTVFGADVKRKGDTVTTAAAATKMDKCDQLVRTDNGACSTGHQYDTCFGITYKQQKYIDGLSNIDTNDYIFQEIIDASVPRNFIWDTAMRNALHNFHQYGSTTAGNTNEFKEMWETMLLGISSDLAPIRGTEPGYKRIGFEEYAIFPPFGYYGLNLDIIPDVVAGIAADEITADKKSFIVHPDNFPAFLNEITGLKPDEEGASPYLLLKPKLPVHTGGVYGDEDISLEHFPLNSSERLYNLNLHVWNSLVHSEGNIGLNYLINWDILVSNAAAASFEENRAITQPWLQLTYRPTLPEANRKIPNPFLFRRLDSLANITEAMKYKLRKIAAGDNGDFIREFDNGILKANILTYQEFRDANDLVQYGPFCNYFREPGLPDSLEVLTILVNDLESGAANHSNLYTYLHNDTNLANLRADASAVNYAALRVNLAEAGAQFGGGRRSTRKKSRYSKQTMTPSALPMIPSSSNVKKTKKNRSRMNSPRNNTVGAIKLKNTISLQSDIRNYTRNNKASPHTNKKLNKIVPSESTNTSYSDSSTSSRTMDNKVSFFPQNLSTEVRKIISGPNPPIFIKLVKEEMAKDKAENDAARAKLAKFNPKN